MNVEINISYGDLDLLLLFQCNLGLIHDHWIRFCGSLFIRWVTVLSQLTNLSRIKRTVNTDNKGTEPRALSIHPRIPEISVGSSNGTDHFGLGRSEYSGPALNVVYSDRSGHFGPGGGVLPYITYTGMCRPTG